MSQDTMILISGQPITRYTSDTTGYFRHCMLSASHGLFCCWVGVYLFLAIEEVAS
jgi:hypothetical protein